MILAALLMASAGFSVTPNYGHQAESYVSITIRKSRFDGVTVMTPFFRELHEVVTSRHRESGQELVLVSVVAPQGHTHGVLASYSKRRGVRLVHGDIMMPGASVEGLAKGRLTETSYSHYLDDRRYPHGTPMTRPLAYNAATGKLRAGPWRKAG